jgi:hypothetical protein
MRTTITANELSSYLGEADPILRRLEALTRLLVDARIALNGDETGDAAQAFLDACAEAPRALEALSVALLDAKGRLVGLLPPTDADRQ